MHVADPEGRYKLFQYLAGGERKKWFRLRPGVAVSGTTAGQSPAQEWLGPIDPPSLPTLA
jgi:hypothetical protein